MDKIDRIYRALFVHSVGFHQMLQDFTEHTQDAKHNILANVWRVF